MKLSVKVLMIVVVFAIFTAYLIGFQLVPSLKQRYLNEKQQEYYTYLNNNIDYLEGFIDNIGSDINYLIKSDLLYQNEEYYFTSFVNAQSPGFIYNPNDTELELGEFFEDYNDANPDIKDIFVGFPDGSFLTADPISLIGDNVSMIYNFDPRVRPWYKKAMSNKGEIVVSPLYQRIELLENTDIKDPENYYLTVAKTLEDSEGNAIGVMGVNVELFSLLGHMDTVTKSKIYSLGILFENGIACQLSKDELAVEADFYQTEMFERLEEINEEKTPLCSYDAGNSCVIKKTSESANVSLFYVVDMDTIKTLITRNLQSIIITIVFSISVFVILILILMNFAIVSPINKLNKVTSYISRTMDLSKKAKHETKDEIGNLAGSFNHMVSEMKKYRDQMDVLVKKRTLQLSKFSTAIEQSTAAVLITDTEGIIEYVSPKFTEITGYNEDEVIGQRPKMLRSGYHEDEFYKDLWDTLLSGSDWEGIFKNKKKNGEYFYDRSRISPIKDEDGNVINFVAIKEDITERKRIQDKLRDALEDNQLLLESVGDGIVGVDLNTRITFANRKARDILGYEKGELIGVEIGSLLYKKYDILNPDVKNGKAIVDRIKNGREVYIEKEIVFKKDGDQFVAEISCVPIVRDENLLGAVVVFKDITEKLNIEYSLDTLFENMPTGFADHEMIYDENGNPIEYKYIKINNSFQKLTGFTESVVGKSIMTLMPDAYKKWVKIYDGIVKSKKPKTFEDYVETMGKYFRITAFPTGEKTFATLFDDISQSKLAAKKLLENEKRLSFIFEASPFPVVTTVKGIIYYANSNYVKMTGLDIRDSTLDSFCIPEDRSRLFEMAANDQNIVNFETKIYNAKNEEITVLISVIKTDIEGEAGMLAWLMDISDLKRVEDQLIIAKEQAEAATEAKSDFLANMSHEIRTPMNAVIGLNKLLKKTNLNMQQADYVDKIERSASQLLNIINDILDFSKIESGKMDVENIEFDVGDVIKDQISIISLSANEKDIEIIVDKDIRVPRIVKGDPHRLGQVIGNLINNSIKFTKEGHVIISVYQEDKTKDTVKLKFTITDTGIGMSQEQINKLFMPFSQADTSTTRKYGGTGLGLVITKELVEMMDGHISVTSKENEGSSFEFVLPFKTIKEKEEKYTSEKDANILVIEENILTRNIIGRYLQQFGYKYILADSSKEAAEYIKEHRFDVILLHNSASEMNRIIWEKIAGFYKDKKTPKVIFMQNTGNANMNFDDYDVPYNVLVKPIFPSVLYDTLSESLYEKRVVEDKNKDSSAHQKELASLNEARVLVVEDNEINRLVVKDILRNAGVEVDEAENGQEAIEAVHNNHYDLVLMDIQMPVLDGYKSTIEIRKKYTKEQLPIIALTADVVLETRNKALEIGMNDYLGKPIDIKKLYSKLAKWLKIKTAVASAGIYRKEDEIIELMNDILYDFNVEGAFERLAGNSKFYIKLLNKFKEDNTDLMAKLYDSFEREDYNEFRMLVHSQKGVAAYLGAEKLTSEFKNIEKEMNGKKDKQRVKSSLYNIDKALRNIFNEIRIMNTKCREMGMFKDEEKNSDEKTATIIEIKRLIELIRTKNVEAKKIINGLKFRINNNNIKGMLDITKDYLRKKEYDKAKSVAEDVLDMIENLHLE